MDFGKYRTVTLSQEQHTLLCSIVSDFVESLEKSAGIFGDDHMLKRKYRFTVEEIYRAKAAEAQAVADLLHGAETIWLNKADL